jgi:hypothetical protein
VDLTEFQTNLVPYPRIHFPLAGIKVLHVHKRKSIFGFGGIFNLQQLNFTNWQTNSKIKIEKSLKIGYVALVFFCACIFQLSLYFRLLYRLKELVNFHFLKSALNFL